MLPEFMQKPWKTVLLTYLCNIGALAPYPLGRSSDMALLGNNIYRKLHREQEEAADMDQQLSRMEDDIRKLKIDFDVYFNGMNANGLKKRPPLEARARLESFIKRIADNRNLTYAQRYYFNTLVSRFTSYRELWRRTLKAKGEEFV
jgi:hypothetical protein